MEVIQLDNYVKLMKVGIDSLNDNNIYKDTLYLGLSQIQEFEKEKLDKEEANTVFSFRIISEKYPSGSIDLTSLNDTTRHIQEALITASSNLTGFSGSRGPAPQDIIERNRLIITSTRAGSFIVNLRPNTPSQTELFSEQNSSIEILEDLLLKIEEPSKIIDVVEKYGVHTWNSLKKWVNSLEKNDLEFEFFNKQDNKKIGFDKLAIHNINVAFKENTVKEEFLKETIIGTLIKIDNNAKEITIKDDRKKEDIKIFIKDNSLKTAHLISNDKYSIDLEVQSVRYNNNKETVRYIADSVKTMKKL